MGNVIEFLARVGEDASLRHASDEALGEFMSEAGMVEAVTALHAQAEQNAYFVGQMPGYHREAE
jgi:hypothetical protein